MRLKAVSGTILTLLLTAVVTFSLCSLVLLELAYASPYTDIGVDTAYNMITNGSYPDLVVLDVRSQDEYDSGHIFGAVWIPHTELESRIGELVGHENHETIVYCGSGFRSQIASEILDSYNFTKVYNMLGGISAWQSAGYPVWIATVHNVNTTFNYDTIQAAIDAPETLDGHTIRVDAGTYYENVLADKSVSLIAEDRSTTIIDANLVGTAINVTANNIEIVGFTIQNSGPVPYHGIYVGEWSNGNNISYNIIANNGHGIWLNSSSNNTISENNIKANKGLGIYLYYSSNNTISENNITNNEQSIVLHQSLNNTISLNKITNNDYGILLGSSSNNTIKNNIADSNTEYGIHLNWYSSNNSISGNKITNNDYGIWFFYSSNNSISGNKITTSNWHGIRLEVASNNTFSGNNIVDNYFGIRLVNASDNSIFHNNFINNTNQAYIDPEYPLINTWDDGYPSGGNYWSDYNPRDEKSGPHQNETDGCDGIGDEPYIVDGNNEDRYPLIYPYGWAPSPDINNDGFVDIYDIVLISMAFGSYPGHPHWNPVTDVKGPDCVIDIFDVVLVAKYFGSTWPPSTS